MSLIRPTSGIYIHILTCKNLTKKKRVNRDSIVMSPHGQFIYYLCHKNEKSDLATAFEISIYNERDREM